MAASQRNKVTAETPYKAPPPPQVFSAGGGGGNLGAKEQKTSDAASFYASRGGFSESMCSGLETTAALSKYLIIINYVILNKGTPPESPPLAKFKRVMKAEGCSRQVGGSITTSLTPTELLTLHT